VIEAVYTCLLCNTWSTDVFYLYDYNYIWYLDTAFTWACSYFKLY